MLITPRERPCNIVTSGGLKTSFGAVKSTYPVGSFMFVDASVQLDVTIAAGVTYYLYIMDAAAQPGSGSSPTLLCEPIQVVSNGSPMVVTTGLVEAIPSTGVWVGFSSTGAGVYTPVTNSIRGTVRT